MELAVTILRVALRVLLVLVTASLAGMSQYDDDTAEVGRPRWPAIGVFALLGGLAALLGTFGYWWLASPIVIVLAILALFFKGRTATLGVVCVLTCLIHVFAAPYLAGQPFGWTVDDTVISIIAVLALVTICGIGQYHKTQGLVPERPHAGDELDRNPLVIPTAILALMAIGTTITLAIIG